MSSDRTAGLPQVPAQVQSCSMSMDASAHRKAHNRTTSIAWAEQVSQLQATPDYGAPGCVGTRKHSMMHVGALQSSRDMPHGVRDCGRWGMQAEFCASLSVVVGIDRGFICAARLGDVPSSGSRGSK